MPTVAGRSSGGGRGKATSGRATARGRGNGVSNVKDDATPPKVSPAATSRGRGKSTPAPDTSRAAAASKDPNLDLMAENQALKERLAALEAAMSSAAAPTGRAASLQASSQSAASSAPAPADMSSGEPTSFPAVNSLVELQGLSTEEYNGLLGIVVADRGVIARGRVPVRLDDGRQLNVRPENLKAMQSASASTTSSSASQSAAGNRNGASSATSSTSLPTSDAKRSRKGAGGDSEPPPAESENGEGSVSAPAGSQRMRGRPRKAATDALPAGSAAVAAPPQSANQTKVGGRPPTSAAGSGTGQQEEKDADAATKAAASAKGKAKAVASGPKGAVAAAPKANNDAANAANAGSTATAKAKGRPRHAAAPATCSEPTAAPGTPQTVLESVREKKQALENKGGTAATKAKGRPKQAAAAAKSSAPSAAPGTPQTVLEAVRDKRKAAEEKGNAAAAKKQKVTPSDVSKRWQKLDGPPGSTQQDAGAAGSSGPGNAVPAGGAGGAVRRRVHKKSAVEQLPTVAQMIRKLGNEDNDLATGSNGNADASVAKPTKTELAAAAAEAAEIEAAGDKDGELEGEEGNRKKKAGGKAGGKNGGEEEDDDKLFDDDDLEGEEQLSDLSDIGDMEEFDEEDNEAWEPVNAWNYPKVWSSGALRPGQEGFNDYASECVAKAHLGTKESPLAGLGLRLHQESVGFLVHPESPIERILVDHATGTGKTLIMLRLLENFFDDPRPKVAIFPKDKICDNFYQEMLKWPTRWRDYFSASRPLEASIASGAANWKRKKGEMWDLNNERLRAEAKRRNIKLEKVVSELIAAIREVLEMKNSIRSGKLKTGFAKKFRKENPGVPVPRAPLRAFRYTTAGGGACEPGKDGWPRSPILKVGFDKNELNPYSRKVVIMDECHNLTRPTVQYEEQLGRLREHLQGCKETVLAGFTGTPVGDQHEFIASVDRAEDSDLGLEFDESFGDSQLFVKDVRRGSLVEDWNVENPRAQVKSGDVVVAVNFLRGVTAERLLGELLKFGTLRIACQRQEGRLLLDVIKGRAAALCSDEGFVSSFHARGSSDFCKEHPVKGIPDGIIHEGMFDDLVKRHSLHGEALKRYILKEVEFQIVPRLMRLPEEKRMARLSNYCNLHVHYGSFYGTNRDMMLKDVKDYAPKMHGIAKSVAKNKEKAVVLMAREMGFKAMLEVLRKTGRKAGFRVATLDELSDFNDAKRNLRGERFRVLLAETSQAGEGVQFKNVRRVYLADVPLRHSDLVQRTSRCVRLGGHAALPEEERSLAIEVHTAQLPKFMRHGPGSLIYRELLNAKDVHATPGPALENATMACLEELKSRNVKTLLDFQKELAVEGGDKLIDLLTETALEHLCGGTTAPARPLSMALWRLRRGCDDLAVLEKALQKVRTADEILLDWLVDKSAELLPPLEAMRLGAVDRKLLAPLGDPPAAPPPRSEAAKKKKEKALRQMKQNVRASAPADVKDDGIQLDDDGNEIVDDLEEALADVEALNEVLAAEDDEEAEDGDEFDMDEGDGEEEDMDVDHEDV